MSILQIISDYCTCEYGFVDFITGPVDIKDFSTCKPDACICPNGSIVQAPKEGDAQIGPPSSGIPPALVEAMGVTQEYLLYILIYFLQTLPENE